MAYVSKVKKFFENMSDSRKTDPSIGRRCSSFKDRKRTDLKVDTMTSFLNRSTLPNFSMHSSKMKRNEYDYAANVSPKFKEILNIFDKPNGFINPSEDRHHTKVQYKCVQNNGVVNFTAPTKKDVKLSTPSRSPYKVDQGYKDSPSNLSSILSLNESSSSYYTDDLTSSLLSPDSNLNSSNISVKDVSKIFEKKSADSPEVWHDASTTNPKNIQSLKNHDLVDGCSPFPKQSLVHGVPLDSRSYIRDNKFCRSRFNNLDKSISSPSTTKNIQANKKNLQCLNCGTSQFLYMNESQKKFQNKSSGDTKTYGVRCRANSPETQNEWSPPHSCVFEEVEERSMKPLFTPVKDNIKIFEKNKLDQESKYLTTPHTSTNVLNNTSKREIIQSKIAVKDEKSHSVLSKNLTDNEKKDQLGSPQCNEIKQKRKNCNEICVGPCNNSKISQSDNSGFRNPNIDELRYFRNFSINNKPEFNSKIKKERSSSVTEASPSPQKFSRSRARRSDMNFRQLYKDELEYFGLKK